MKRLRPGADPDEELSNPERAAGGVKPWGRPDRVQELIAAKARGETPEVTPEPSAVKQADLSAALEASLAGGGR
jgi:hypothetical protein